MKIVFLTESAISRVNPKTYKRC